METITAFFTELGQLALDHIYAVLAFATTTIIAIIGLIYTRRQDRRAIKQETAIPSLSLKFFGFSDDDVKDYFFLLPFEEKRAIFMPLIFELANAGDGSAQEVELYYHVSEELYRSDGIKRSPPSFATARKMNLAVDPVTGSETVQVFLDCRSLAPKVKFQLGDTAIIKGETYRHLEMPVETKDHVKLNLTMYFYAWFTITISVMAKDIAPQKKQFNLHFRKKYEDPKFGFLAEETKRRSKVSLKGLNEEARKAILISPSTKNLMHSLGMAYEVDQPFPDKFALIWFENEFVPDFVPQDEVPEEHDIIGVSGEKVEVLSTKTIGRNKKMTER